MRNLTIKRTKTFVASLMKLKVCIEDPKSTELTVSGIPCRMLGTVKNGEEKTFRIDEEQRKVFVIADNISKDVWNEFYDIPAGDSDIFLSGKNKFNPANGNAFRFDNNDSAQVLANRKSGNRKGFFILCAALIIDFLIGYFAVSALFSGGFTRTKTFSSNGMNITLTDKFVQTSAQGFTVCYDSPDVAVFALKEKFSMAEGFGDITLDEYRDLIVAGNNLTSAEKKEINGLKALEYVYKNPQKQQTYRYYTFVYKTDDAFWTLQFVCLDKESSDHYKDILKWVGSVEFSD